MSSRAHLTAPDWLGQDFKACPQAVRNLGRALRDALTKRGHALREQLCWVPVQGKDKGESNTRERSMHELRFEACLGLLLKLVRHVDLQTRIVCRGEDGDIKGLKMARIAEQLGLDDRTVARAMHDLHAAGFVVSKRRSAFKDGQHLGRTSVRVLSESVIALCGMAGEWAQAAKKAYNKARQKLAEGVSHLDRLHGERLQRNGRDFQQARTPQSGPARPATAPPPLGEAQALGTLLSRLPRAPRPA